MIETFLFLIPPTLNEIIRTARANIYKSASEKRRWTRRIVIDCDGKHHFPGEVWMEFVWQVKNQRSDIDNVAAAAKYILDGLVQAEVIKDDSLKYIKSPVIHWYESGKNLVEVRIADYPIFNGNVMKTISKASIFR